MINWIRNLLLDRILKQVTTIKYVGWKNAKTILLLVDSKPNEDQAHVLDLKNRLENEGKTIMLLTFVAAKKTKEGSTEGKYFLGDTTFFGQPKSAVKELVKDEFDVVIYWASKAKSPNVFLTAEAGTSLKVGIASTLSFFDLTIADYDTNHQKTIEETLKFLKLINHE